MKKVLFSFLMLTAVPVFATWDVTTPAGTEAKSLGDDRIRELKTDIQTSLRHEGDFPGPDTANPRFIYTPSSGTTAQRPTGSTNTAAGMFYVNSSSGCIEQYNGSSWNCVQAISATDAGSGLVGGAGSPLAVNLDPLLFQVTTDSVTFVANPVVHSSITFAGNVTFASKPSFLVRYTGALQSIADGGTVSFNSEVFDTAGNIANSTFTAPSSGVYFFTASANSVPAPTDAAYCHVNIVTSQGTFSSISANDVATDEACGGTVSVVISLNQNDTAYVTMDGSGTNALAVLGTAASINSAHFSGYKVQN